MADGGLMQVQVIARVAAREEAGDLAQAYLTRWGVWLRQGGAGAQGYAHETAEGRLRREGTLLHGTGGGRRLSEDPLAERVDRIVARLALDDRRWPLMLKVYFGGEDATYATTACLLGREFGGAITAERVRVWMREAIATVRGELRAAGLA